ncbi:MOSC N-terminal beta barrel domain-containing protein [Thalassiella azotivora]
MSTGQDGDVVGTVTALRRYPLKSAGGQDLDAVDVGADGLRDDRRWALVDPHGAPLTAKERPRLREVSARVVEGALLTEPALQQVVGDHEVVDEPGGHQRVAAVHLVSEDAHAAADAPGGCDPFPRANLVLRLDRPGDERHWVGRELQVGAVRLGVTREPRSCLGVYAEVLRPGRVAVGDEVRVRPQPPGTTSDPAAG